MDNFRFDVTHDSEEALKHVLAIAFDGHAKAIGYRQDKDKGLVLYWTERPEMIPLPFKIDAEAARVVVMGWLAEQDYGKDPDHDGSNKRGWRAYNEAWGRIGDDYGAFLAVQPVWATYGK